MSAGIRGRERCTVNGVLFAPVDRVRFRSALGGGGRLVAGKTAVTRLPGGWHGAGPMTPRRALLTWTAAAAAAIGGDRRRSTDARLCVRAPDLCAARTADDGRAAGGLYTGTGTIAATTPGGTTPRRRPPAVGNERRRWPAPAVVTPVPAQERGWGRRVRASPRIYIFIRNRKPICFRHGVKRRRSLPHPPPTHSAGVSEFSRRQIIIIASRPVINAVRVNRRRRRRRCLRWDQRN